MVKKTKQRLSKSISSIRLSEETKSRMERGIEKYNKKSLVLVPMKDSFFVRFAIELFAYYLNNDKISELPIKLNIAEPS